MKCPKRKLDNQITSEVGWYDFFSFFHTVGQPISYFFGPQFLKLSGVSQIELKQSNYVLYSIIFCRNVQNFQHRGSTYNRKQPTIIAVKKSRPIPS